MTCAAVRDRFRAPPACFERPARGAGGLRLGPRRACSPSSPATSSTSDRSPLHAWGLDWRLRVRALGLGDQPAGAAPRLRLELRALQIRAASSPPSSRTCSTCCSMRRRSCCAGRGRFFLLWERLSSMGGFIGCVVGGVLWKFYRWEREGLRIPARASRGSAAPPPPRRRHRLRPPARDDLRSRGLRHRARSPRHPGARDGALRRRFPARAERRPHGDLRADPRLLRERSPLRSRPPGVPLPRCRGHRHRRLLGPQETPAHRHVRSGRLHRLRPRCGSGLDFVAPPRIRRGTFGSAG